MRTLIFGLAALMISGSAFAAGKVSFAEPKDGAVVKSPFKVKFKVEGMKVAPAGAEKAGTGHHHLIVDGQPVAKGEVVPKDDTHLHFGKGETEKELTLPQGEHTLTLQFADGEHKSYGPDMAATIHVTVQDAAQPPVKK
jgi:hypothetical protein